MSTLYIYGASDDLIEVEGLVRDEFNMYDQPAVVTVKVDDAVYTSLWIGYDTDESGEWRVQPTSLGDLVEIVSARGEDEGNDEHGCPGYSDKAIVDMQGIEARQVSVSVKAVKS